MTRQHHLHLVSDSTGGTLNGVVRAALVQFNLEHNPTEHLWNLVRTERQLNRVIDGITENPGPVLCTLVDDTLAMRLHQACHALDVPMVSILQPVIQHLSRYFGQESRSEPGLQHTMDEAYFNRISAVDFALHHDDGQRTGHSLKNADVILLGVSRTSKTPTSVYLAYRGIKAANIPLVPNAPLPDDILNLQGPLFVGLTESPKRLAEIRKNRLRDLNEQTAPGYLDPDHIEQEVRDARKLFTRMGWPVIDVTQKSIEETAAEIVSLLHRKREAHGPQTGQEIKHA